MTTRSDAFARMSLTSSEIGDFAQQAGSLFSFLPPVAEWMEKQDEYRLWWEIFSGEIWKRLVNGTQDPATPLQINHPRVHANLHAMLTLGSTPSEQIIRLYAEPFVVNPNEEGPLEDRFLGRVIESVFKENGWLDFLPRASRLFQAFGGVFFKVVHDPVFVNGVRIEVIAPDQVFPIWDSRGNLIDVWVINWIPVEEAAYYGLDVDRTAQRVLYVEHWTREAWTIMVGREGDELQVARLPDGSLLQAPNPYLHKGDLFPVVPFFYAGRNLTKGAYGVSIIADMMGLAREINETGAYIGEAISENAKRERYATDWRGNRDGQGRIVVIPARDEIIDAGITPAGAEKTEVFTLDPPKLDVSYIQFLKWLDAQSFDSSLTAPVMVGRDEGSQRSGETLAARALPTVTSVSYYRASLAETIHRVACQSLLCMTLLPAWNQETGTRNGITPDQVRGSRINVDWSPMLPRERREIVEIETMLFGAGLRSLEMALFQLGDVRNILEEADRIRKAASDKAKEQLQQQLTVAAATKPESGAREKPASQ